MDKQTPSVIDDLETLINQLNSTDANQNALALETILRLSCSGKDVTPFYPALVVCAR